MKLFGLTGGIGMGKSTAGEMLRQRGLVVIDTDAIAREIVEPGQPALEEIRKRFGAEVLLPGGGLNRDAMAAIAFASSEARADLETMLHPRIRAIWTARVQQWEREGLPACVVTIPLLFEAGSAALFTATVCVACSVETQWNRLRQRGWDETEIRRRIAAQWPIERKMDVADHVIWTDTSFEIHSAQLDRVFAGLTA